MNQILGKDKPVVLVIDDTPDNLQLMSGILQGQYRVKVANNGERGLKIAMADPAPDVILLDVMMPDVDGYEVCRRLKAEPKTQAIPVIFLTAKAAVEDETMGFGSKSGPCVHPATYSDPETLSPKHPSASRRLALSTPTLRH